MSTQQKQEVTFDIAFEKNISRLFIFRGLWMVIEMWVIVVRAFWMGLISFVQFWHMLILGRRHEGRWKKKYRFFRHILKRQLYLSYMTNERPKFIED